MIPVRPPEEPRDFDAECRRKGSEWLARHAREPGRPRDFWSPFKRRLAEGFDMRCGYSAIFEPTGTVDHYKSWRNEPRLAYEWSNLRYASGWINASKQNADGDVLDPFLVGEGWFEILLPSLQLVVSDDVPPAMREKAERTIDRLHLCDDERVIAPRAEWYRMFLEGELNLEGLRKKAPLIAAAHEKQVAATCTE